MSERIIQDRGQYQFSLEERKASRIKVFGGALVEPENQYSNFKYRVPQSFYGYAQLVSGELVLQTFQLKYQQELICELSRPITDYLTEQFYCFTIASLNRSAQEWTQYAALPFTLVSIALQAFFLDQATQLDPPILDLFPYTALRVQLYSTGVYKLDVRIENFNACVASENIVFEEPQEVSNPPSFPVSPPGSVLPSPPYPTGDQDTPGNPSNPNAIGTSGYNYGQFYGSPNTNQTIRLTIDTPNGGCDTCSPVPGIISCSEYPYFIDVPVTGTWSIETPQRKRTQEGSSIGSYFVTFTVFDAGGASVIPYTLISGSYNPPNPDPFAVENINCLVDKVSIQNVTIL